jgi:hypothetical protein
MRRYGLRDDQWAWVQDLLPGRVGHVGVTAQNNRLFVVCCGVEGTAVAGQAFAGGDQRAREIAQEVGSPV